MGRLLCGLLHPYTPVEKHRAVQHKGFNSKAKQNGKGNGAVLCSSVAAGGNGWNWEIKDSSSNSQNNAVLRLYLNFSEKELLGLTAVRAGSNPAWAQPVAAGCPHTDSSAASSFLSALQKAATCSKESKRWATATWGAGWDSSEWIHHGSRNGASRTASESGAVWH